MVDKKEEEGALELWRRWFEFSGDPWESAGFWGTDFCFFCREDHPNHKPDCVYIAAKELVGYEEDD
jgi:hypothetical protein